MNTKCVKCGKGPLNGNVPVYRINAKGEPGVFACKQHRDLYVYDPDPVIDEIVEAIQNETATGT